MTNFDYIMSLLVGGHGGAVGASTYREEIGMGSGWGVEQILGTIFPYFQERFTMDVD
jgi:hypothetical protein